MDDAMFIRSGIFLVAGFICIIFRKQLNNRRNRFFSKLYMKKWEKDNIKAYIYAGIIFIIISIILFSISIN